ncbi:MAG TPA: 3-phosphoshikimate 1-carboxyvinyltransferase [Anaerolineae bacterium]|nr:3-phosphoshikimate 1-carboxyvinyltransferase [Anaerolineae bacterium]
MNLLIHPTQELYGSTAVPGDKSISHRAAMFAALAEGRSHVRNFLPGGDCQATLGVLRALGVAIDEVSPSELLIDGQGLHGLVEPAAPLDCVNSGTTMRLMAGLLAGQRFFSVLSGSPQLTKRPMGRVVEPLRQMGAVIHGRQGGKLAPLAILGSQLRHFDYKLPVASAQVKSALLLAGLYSDGLAVVRQPGPARDHTERMLAAMGAPIRVLGSVVTSERPKRPLTPLDMVVPGDISSAAFLLVAGLLVPNSHLTVTGVGVNPTRTGILDILRLMGADLRIENLSEEAGEPVADIVVTAQQSGGGATPPLRGVEIGGDLIVRAIDELPVLAVLATQAHGRTVVRDAAELRVKETDRIATVAAELRALGAHVEEYPDGFAIDGPVELHSAPVWSHGDHRLAMALAVAGLVASGPVLIEEAECISDSFPGFERTLRVLGVELEEG